MDSGTQKEITLYSSPDGMNSLRARALIFLLIALSISSVKATADQIHSVARRWNEVLLEAIRNDFARPPIHARNLYHVSVAMWDAWATYDETALPVLAREEKTLLPDVPTARHEAISYAAYRVLYSRYRDSPGAYESLTSFESLMEEFGYDPKEDDLDGLSPAAVGNRIGQAILEYGYADGSDELGSYAFEFDYRPVNTPLLVQKFPPDTDGNRTSDEGTDTDSNQMPNGAGIEAINDPNRWQPLALRLFVDQAGRLQPGNVQRFIGSHWGRVTPFSLSSISTQMGGVYMDPGPPPFIGATSTNLYQETFSSLIKYSATLTPNDNVKIDISPMSRGNNSLGKNDGSGYRNNPTTGMPYEKNIVKRGDWTRVIAEFWADGPDSETPPGHWNTLANYVTDHPEQNRRIGGDGTQLDPLEWDVKLYLALNGAVHDAAICAWGIKGYYDYVRPITAIRYMSKMGQSSDPLLPRYHPHGMRLIPGFVEVISEDSSTIGARHNHLAEHIGSIAVLSWTGKPENPETQFGGVDWILGTDWIPYQRETFVTPPFAGYISGHSTFSRAAAEVLAKFTGSKFFPGGLGEHVAPANDFLVFESGPTETVILQWATYYDASDEAAMSRLYGGIHPSADDLPGRIIGSRIGLSAFEKALTYFGNYP